MSSARARNLRSALAPRQYKGRHQNPKTSIHLNPRDLHNNKEHPHLGLKARTRKINDLKNICKERIVKAFLRK